MSDVYFMEWMISIQNSQSINLGNEVNTNVNFLK